MNPDDQTDNPLHALRDSVGADARMQAAAADRLEASLRIAHAEGRRSTARRWRRGLALAPAAVVIVAAVSVALVLRSEAPSAAVVLSDAENITVVLPDGEIVVDPEDGFEVPDGAIIEIGEAGTVTIDDVVIDEPARLQVVDGSLVSDVIATTTTPRRSDDVDTTTTAGGRDQPTTTVGRVDETTTTSTTAPPPTTVDRDQPAPTSTVAPSTTLPPERDGDRAVDDGGPDRAPEDPGTDAPAPGDVALRLHLAVERVDGGVRVAWAADGLGDGWTISIRRAIGEGSRVDIVTGGSASGEIVDVVPPDGDGPVRYGVVVLDEAGGQVAVGPIQSLRR